MDNTDQVGPGWAPLIRVLDAEAEKHNATVHQVKQKYGGLRYYYELPEDAAPTDRTYFQNLVEAAEMLAVHMCEKCGAPAVAAAYGGWIATLCKEHGNKQSK